MVIGTNVLAVTLSEALGLLRTIIYTYYKNSIAERLDDIDRVGRAPFTLQHMFMGLTRH